MSADGESSKSRACPVCGRPATRGHHPFCGTRCRAVDLNRWLADVYRVPGKGVAEAPAGDAEDDRED